MLAEIVGSQTAEKIFLHLCHYGSSYPTAVARDFEMSLGQVQRQFDRFENAGVLISQLYGRTRAYQFNSKHPVARKFSELVETYYESIPLEQRQKLFKTRRRPRRRGKPVVSRL